MYLYFEYLFVGITVVCLIKSLTLNKKEIFIKDKTYFTYLLILSILVCFVSLYRLTELPYGLHVDEAGMAYDAYALAHFSTDRYLHHFPVYLTNYGGGQSALCAYLCAILIKIFGISTLIIRLPLTILKIIGFISLFSIFKKERLQCLIILLLYTITPYFIMQSRFALDCNLMMPMLCISTASFMQSIRSHNHVYFFFSGLLFGLSLYTYALSYITIPLYLLIMFIYLLLNRKINFSQIISFSIPLITLAIPLILTVAVNQGYISQISSWITMPQLLFYRSGEISLSNIYENMYFFKVLFTSDNQSIFGNLLDYNALPTYKTLYLFSSIFVVYGFVLSMIKLKKFNNTLNMTFFTWSLASLCTILIISSPNINKANAIFVPMIYFASVAIFEISKRRSILILILSMYFISFGFFIFYYFTDYNDHDSHLYWFATDYIDALNYAQTLDVNEIYSTNVTAENYIYVHLFEQIDVHDFNRDHVHSPSDDKDYFFFDEININEIKREACYITDNYHLSMIQQTSLNFDYHCFNDVVVILFNE